MNGATFRNGLPGKPPAIRGRAMERRDFAQISLDNSLPYHYQITNLIRESIWKGRLAPGQKLPNELELARIHGVSRIPVRQALAQLELDGLIRREHGRGTFVAEDFHRPPVVKLTGIVGWEVDLGTKHRIIAEETTSAGGHLAEFFNLAVDEAIVRFRRLRVVEGAPFYVVNYMPPDLAKRVDRADLQFNTMLDILEKKLRIPIGMMQQSIQAVAADTEVAGHLHIEVMKPVLLIENFTRSRKGRPLLYSQSFYRGNQSKYLVEVNSRPERKRKAAVR